jgi:hypothetical protein
MSYNSGMLIALPSIRKVGCISLALQRLPDPTQRIQAWSEDVLTVSQKPMQNNAHAISTI